MFLITVIGVLGVGITNAVPLSSLEVLSPTEVESRIIGGVDAPESYSPHMAALIFGDKIQIVTCGGSIISRRLVLTAAHCIENLVMNNGQLIPSFHLRIGSNQWNSGGTIVHVKNHHMHPRWDPQNFKYDVGILELEKPVVLSATVGIVQLDYDYVGGSEECVVTGWGRTGPRWEGDVVNLQPTPINLQLLYVSTLLHEKCQRLIKEHAGNSWAPPIDKQLEICTLHSKGHGMCVGDSGSALILKKTGRLIALVSWGFGCAEGAPDVFASVYGARPFLENFITTYED